MKVLLVCPPGFPVKHTKVEQKYWNAYIQLRVRKTFWRLTAEQLAKLGNSEHQNVGPLSIATYLKRAGHEVGYFSPLYDDLAPEKRRKHYGQLLKAKLEQFKPSVVGFSAHSCAFLTAAEWAGIAKEMGAKTVLGGPHASGVKDGDLSEALSKFDFLVRGPGEVPMSMLCDAISSDAEIDKIKQIPGIAFLEGSNVVTAKKWAEQLFPEPDNTLMYIDSLPAARVYSQMGCGHRCAFCCDRILNNGNMKRALDTVEQEILFFQQRFGSTYIYLGNQNIFRDKKHTLELLSMLRRFSSTTSFGFQGNVSDFDEDIIRAISALDRRAEIQFGIESASSQVLDAVHKSVPTTDIERILEITKSHGLITSGNWIVGLPGATTKTEETSILTIKKLMESGLLDFAEIRMPVIGPCSSVYENPSHYGVKLRGRNWNLYRGETKPQFELDTLDSNEIYALYLKCVGVIAEQLEKQIRKLGEYTAISVGAKPSVNEGLF